MSFILCPFEKNYDSPFSASFVLNFLNFNYFFPQCEWGGNSWYCYVELGQQNEQIEPSRSVVGKQNWFRVIRKKIARNRRATVCKMQCCNASIKVNNDMKYGVFTLFYFVFLNLSPNDINFSNNIYHHRIGNKIKHACKLEPFLSYLVPNKINSKNAPQMQIHSIAGKLQTPE